MKLMNIDDGEKFILNRTGRKYKRIGQYNGWRVLVKPVNHCVGVIGKIPNTLNIQCEVTACH